METALVLSIGVLYSAAIYSLLRRSAVRLALGLVLLGSATNLTLFVTNRVTRANPPLLPPSGVPPLHLMADPLPQAFVLTAIVINFGLLALLLVLVHRTDQAVGSDDMDEMRTEVPPSSSHPPGE
ncbi:NADH-quinone oxidoreductase subunit K [Archangium lansingense]|uniref:NADH-quinone oxidoreductase subunit K n=1 Tax=Archangium lansingense TaxID=2995310 RepID=A0ABT4AHV5_9BACT|nr:NADH-quinone oxidoreductase subunit K [Archangium lansinium]MCY1081230.1 NADH-quinone oxidoreductase subunit K [Archangium lansinium]